MNKLHIFGMMALAAFCFTSCQDDDSPKISEPTEFVLNTPPFAEQLYELAPGGVLEITCSQPNYGLTLATTYNVEISMLEDFGESLPAPEEGEAPHAVTLTPPNPHSAAIQIPENKIAEAICAMRGITTEEEYTEIPAHPLYVRAIADVAGQPLTTIVSNTVKLAQVKGYCAFEAKVYDVIYNPGNANGWNFDQCQQLEAYETGKYRGFLYINGEFKFTPAPNWDSDWGKVDDAPGKLAVKGGNLPVPDEGEGLYYVEVDLNSLSYTTLLVTSVGLVGDLNGWSASSPIAMTSDNHIVWSATANFTGGGFRFVFNGPDTDWKYNLGGEFDELKFDAGNLPDEAGSHTVTLDLSKIPYTATFE